LANPEARPQHDKRVINASTVPGRGEKVSCSLRNPARLAPETSRTIRFEMSSIGAGAGRHTSEFTHQEPGNG
jgi:hypothetical protein